MRQDKEIIATATPSSMTTPSSRSSGLSTLFLSTSEKKMTTNSSDPSNNKAVPSIQFTGNSSPSFHSDAKKIRTTRFRNIPLTEEEKDKQVEENTLDNNSLEDEEEMKSMMHLIDLGGSFSSSSASYHPWKKTNPHNDLPIPLDAEIATHTKNQSNSYFANSFYQSYGSENHSYLDEIPHHLNFTSRETIPLPPPLPSTTSNPLLAPPSPAVPKPLLSMKDLMSVIVEDATYKHTIETIHDEQEDNQTKQLFLDGEIDLGTKLDSFLLIPAEEDGSPMDDLPSCNINTDLLNMGVRDFVILDKSTLNSIVHIRIEGNVAPNQPYEGVINKNCQILQEEEAMNHPLLQREESYQTNDSKNSGGEGDNNSYYTLNDSDSLTNPDMIQAFRTDTDELKLQELQKAQEELAMKLAENTVSNSIVSPITSPVVVDKTANRRSYGNRHRSSSGNLMISYRNLSSERWRVAKRLTVLPELPLKSEPIPVLPVSTIIKPKIEPNLQEVPILKTPLSARKEEVANQVRQQLSQPVKIIPETTKSGKFINQPYFTTTTTADGLDRRHSERPYDEEIDEPTPPYQKYGRKYSSTGSDPGDSGGNERKSSFMDLHPHTSLSFSAQFSPSLSVHSRDDSDDDQLGLIQIDRKLPLSKLGSSTSSTPTSFSGRNLGKDENLYSFDLTELKSTKQSPHLLAKKNLKSVRSQLLSESNTNNSSNAMESYDKEENEVFYTLTAERLAKNRLNQLPVSSNKKKSSFPTQMYHDDVDGRNSDNNSTKSSSTKGSVLNRLYELFSNSSKKRPSLASESNDSLSSSTHAKYQQQIVNERIMAINRQLPIVQNLDTGDTFPIGALKYEAVKLPETVSPSVLFGNQTNDKIHR